MENRVLSLITKDQEVVEDIQALLDLFPDWQLKMYSNPDKAWIDHLRKEPELTIVDLDLTGISSETATNNFHFNSQSFPLLLFISQEARTSLHGTFAAEMGAIDHIQKPINLDRIVFALSIASGPVDKPSPELV